MAAQALRMLPVLGQRGIESAICIGGSADSNQQIRGCKLADCADLVDQITAKTLFQMKNLFWQKDSLGPCLDGAKIKQQLSVHSKLKYQVRHLYYEQGLYKGVSGRESLLVGSHRTQRQHLLYEKQRRTTEA
jgi:hypothetical protein